MHILAAIFCPLFLIDMDIQKGTLLTINTEKESQVNTNTRKNSQLSFTEKLVHFHTGSPLGEANRIIINHLRKYRLFPAL